MMMFPVPLPADVVRRILDYAWRGFRYRRSLSALCTYCGASRPCFKSRFSWFIYRCPPCFKELLELEVYLLVHEPPEIAQSPQQGGACLPPRGPCVGDEPDPN